MTEQGHTPHRSAMLEAGKKAQAIVLHYFAAVRGEAAEVDMGKAWKSEHPHDVVTHADREAQDIIERTLLAAFPDYAFYAEENGRHIAVPPKHEGVRRFVVDPIDGTHNFTNGIPDFSIAIAVQEFRRGAWENLAGLVMLPAHGEVYYAEGGRVADFRGKEEVIQVCHPEAKPKDLPPHEILHFVQDDMKGVHGIPVEDAIYAYSSGDFQAAVLRFRGLLAEAGGIARKSYSTAQRLAEIARGRVEGVIVGGDYYEWDVAAGLAIAEQSGATILQREDFGLKVIVAAASPALAHAIEAVWAESVHAPVER